MPRFKYNVTIHCTRQVHEDVLEYLRTELIPKWSTYVHWHSPQLMLIHTGMPEDEMVGYALQFECDDLAKLDGFDYTADPTLRRLIDAYPQRVMPFAVLMEVIE
ncbi:DUF4286 family protein [Porphyromonas cangingivalis]|uniref:Uncharacterized protein n=1 Tax=Porphyromonas cangingivalis TaxID=36874 RepID=A0A099WYW5_PORCN|nr:DUF4286 family protein [Porphyromonas cangingivalis]KGL50062.1 hypothetical protein HQ34_01675 [Porphyromonas cangingivalis]KGN82753.1 hypothetical protein HQ35_02040 [Porphyromonas cangingivalis]SJZ60404.1 protein of unknown function [Porphyromonas cangingivalis]SPY35357.1 Uncharacterised protein [Porphyromonas cangingivalis]VEJ03843.1 Uncharacterised protein [Porphyromonas cangingivalis]